MTKYDLVEQLVYKQNLVELQKKLDILQSDIAYILEASLVIGLFEGSIQKIVALAALMPILAGIGGNSGNQTITMIVRDLTLGQIA